MDESRKTKGSDSNDAAGDAAGDSKVSPSSEIVTGTATDASGEATTAAGSASLKTGDDHSMNCEPGESVRGYRRSSDGDPMEMKCSASAAVAVATVSAPESASASAAVESASASTPTSIPASASASVAVASASATCSEKNNMKNSNLFSAVASAKGNQLTSSISSPTLTSMSSRGTTGSIFRSKNHHHHQHHRRRNEMNQKVSSSQALLRANQALLRAQASTSAAACVKSSRRRSSNNNNNNTAVNNTPAQNGVALGDLRYAASNPRRHQHHRRRDSTEHQLPREPSSTSIESQSSHSMVPLSSSTAGSISSNNTNTIARHHNQHTANNIAGERGSQRQQSSNLMAPQEQQQRGEDTPSHTQPQILLPPPRVPADWRRTVRQDDGRRGAGGGEGGPLPHQQDSREPPAHPSLLQPHLAASTDSGDLRRGKTKRPPPTGEWKHVPIEEDAAAASVDEPNEDVVAADDTPEVVHSAPGPRSLHAAATWNGRILIFGGYDGNERRNDFYSFYVAERRWTRLLGKGVGERQVQGQADGGSLAVGVTGVGDIGDGGDFNPPPSPRDRHAAFVHKNYFYVFGGFDGTSRVNDFHRYDLTTHTWHQIPPTTSSQLPTPRHSHSAIVHHNSNSAYVFGGYDGSYRSDLYQYNFTTHRWSLVPSVGRYPRPRYRATCVAWRDSMVVFGGHDGTRHLDDVYIFDIEGGVWTNVVVGGRGPSARDSHVSFVFGDAMYIFGGSNGMALNDLYELTLAQDGGITSVAVAGADVEQEVVTNGGHVVVGGTGGFVPVWRQVTCSRSCPPQQRFCHVGVMLDNSLYVFGGYDGTERLDDFVRFEFSVDDLALDIPPSTLVSDLRTFLNNDNLCDVTFIIEDQHVRAHKIILTRCSYFSAMFAGNMIEANQSAIHIEDVSHPIFLAVLEYLYTDEVNYNNPAIANGYSTLDGPCMMDLYVAADLFGIPRLQAMCEENILESMYAENSSLIFHAADLFCAKSMRAKAMRYILDNFEAVSKTSTFEQLSQSNAELVFEIVRLR